jgi:hypothetical protein
MAILIDVGRGNTRDCAITGRRGNRPLFKPAHYEGKVKAANPDSMILQAA